LKFNKYVNKEVTDFETTLTFTHAVTVAMSNPFYTNSNPFDEDDDDNYRKKNNPKRSELSHEEQIKRMMMEIDDSEYRQLESTKRALASIDDSERTGIATAEVYTFIYVFICLFIKPHSVLWSCILT
jgi:hypothetical protein